MNASGTTPNVKEDRMAETSETISELNSLIETCDDGAIGFRTAAEGLQDGSIKQLFTTYAREREQFANDLRAEVRRLGGEPDEGGSMSGAIHRGWINIKSAVTGRSDAAIIAEAERGEDVAVAAYKKAMQSDLPSEIKSTIEMQYTSVKAAHDRVRALEKSLSR
jgi:uncharacterized protein (TIGR02284 family)